MNTEASPGPISRLALRLRRITSSGRYLPEVDGLRFIAVAWVVLLHVQGFVFEEIRHNHSVAGDFVSWIFFQGHLGVPLFFSISGFILAMPFAEHALKGGNPVRLKSYFLRRLTRLEPPYIVCMVVLFLLHAIRGQRPLGELLPHLGASLAYLHNAIYQEWNFINTVAWSLEVEVQFYLMAPILARVFLLGTFARRASIIGAILFFAGAEPGLWQAVGVSRPDFWLLGQLHHFLVGFLLADLYLCPVPVLELKERAWDLLGLVAFLAIPAFYIVGTWGKLAFPGAVLVLYLAAFRGGCTRAILRQPVIATLGGMCYSIYLVHLPLIYIVLGVTKRLSHSDHHLVNLLVQGTIVIPIIVLVSSTFYVLIERPCMNKNWPWDLANWFKSRLRPSRPA
ncbi:MAG: acyltransferase [Verrucomicrobia bacterium]|nr:acyltransferase [Verrucomicrobiota bacterium]